MECRIIENNKNCPCRHLDCENHGICCKCVSYHKGSGGLPACLK